MMMMMTMMMMMNKRRNHNHYRVYAYFSTIEPTLSGLAYTSRYLQDVHGQHPVLHNLYARIGKRELFRLRTLRDD